MIDLNRQAARLRSEIVPKKLKEHGFRTVSL
jgi:hypothetical protein